jgi:hypothetical protein
MRKLILILFLLPSVLLFVFPFSTEGQQVLASQEQLLSRYDNSDRIYTKLQIDTVVSYFHQRMIGEAIVERDFIRYQFNVTTEQVIEDSIHWREGLPDRVEPVITREQAEALCEGMVQFSDLWIISPETDIFKLDPIPVNPCWVVSSIDNGRMILTIIDALTGEKLGHGIPPPYEGFTQYGPDWGDCPQPPIYYAYAENARIWFEDMGYSTESVGNASDAKVQSHIQTDQTAMFYELDHGGSTSYHNQCDANITATEIETWINAYASMPFAFIGSCGGLCALGDGNFSFEFRKGSGTGTATVGYCDMSATWCATCWSYAIPWQTELFTHMDAGSTVQYGFTQANLDYPTCAGTNNCTRFDGDASLRVVPVVTRSLCGNVYNGYKGPLNVNTRRHYLRCNITVPTGQTLTIGPGADLIFLNNSKITATGTLGADGSSEQIRMVSESDENVGMEFTGQIEVYNSGEIKIYD